MKNKSSSQSVLICLFILLAFAVCNLPARVGATSTNWIDISSGNWFADANWDNHVPTTSTDAYVNNAGTAQVNTHNPDATAQSLTLGLDAGNSGTVTVDGTLNGTLSIPPGGCPLYTHDIFPGLLSVGYQDTGTLKITNGGTVSSGWGYIAAVSNEVLTSTGSVIVDGTNSIWKMSSPCGAAARLFVGGSYNDQTGMDNAGGTALLTVTNGGTVEVDNPANQVSVKVGPSGTLTGNGTITTNNTNTLAKLTAVQGTLAPKGTLTITKDLAFSSSGTMLCNVTQGNADMVNVLDIAYLDGRVSVIMTGTFNNSITQYTLLKAVNGLPTKFASVSIQYPPNPNFTAKITYDTTHVYLNLVFNP
jgi:hypothetical protein